MEDRNQFLMRLQLMSNEIKASGFDDAHIHKMMEFQLACREKELVRNVKRQVVGELEMLDSRYTTKYFITKANDKFLDVIEDL